MSIATLAPVSPDTFTEPRWTAEDYVIRPPERADCCSTAPAIVLTVVPANGQRVPMRFCGHHTTEYQRAGLDFGEILEDNRDQLTAKPGASA